MVGPLAGLAAGVGAAGGATAASLAFAGPVAAVTYINSYYFGGGMIQGERDMYLNFQAEVQKRIEDGEPMFNILTDFYNKRSTAVLAVALQIEKSVTTFMTDHFKFLFEGQEDAVNKSGLTYAEWARGDAPKIVPQTDTETFTLKTPKDQSKTTEKVKTDFSQTQKEINKIPDAIAREYSTWLNKFVRFNQLLKSLNSLLKRNPTPPLRRNLIAQINSVQSQKSAELIKFTAWKRNNRRWMQVHGYT